MRVDSFDETVDDIVNSTKVKISEMRDLNKLNLLHSSKDTDNPVRMLVESEFCKDTDFKEASMKLKDLEHYTDYLSHALKAA